jgi:hypothetical protein
MQCETIVLSHDFKDPTHPFKRRIRSRAAERGMERSLDCQPPLVEAMEVSITYKERTQRVRVVYDQVAPGHPRAGIPGLLEQMTEKSQPARRR